EELLGGPTPAAATGAAVTGALIKGELPAAPSGRADDFSWPRGVVNVESVAVAPAAPDAAAVDAGAKSAKPGKSVMDAYAAQTGRERKPAHRRARPLAHHPSAYQRPNVSFFGSNRWLGLGIRSLSGPRSVLKNCQTIYSSPNHRCRSRGSAAVAAGKMHTAALAPASP